MICPTTQTAALMPVRWLSWRFPSKGKFSRALFIANVNFLKGQCYFSYAIQVGSLAFLTKLANNESAGDLVAIHQICACLNPPIVVTLFAIFTAGRPSWYLTFLSTALLLILWLKAYRCKWASHPLLSKRPICSSPPAAALLLSWQTRALPRKWANSTEMPILIRKQMSRWAWFHLSSR